MREHRRAHFGQSLLEYAVSLAVVVAALVAMQIYVKRAFSGSLKAAADNAGQQYEPGNTTGSVIRTSFRDTSTIALTLSETVVFQNAGVCLDANGNGISNDICDLCIPSDPAELLALCDFDRDNTCEGPQSSRTFATFTSSCLNQDTSSVRGSETVGPPNPNLWGARN